MNTYQCPTLSATERFELWTDKTCYIDTKMVFPHVKENLGTSEMKDRLSPNLLLFLKEGKNGSSVLSEGLNKLIAWFIAQSEILCSI